MSCKCLVYVCTQRIRMVFLFLCDFLLVLMFLCDGSVGICSESLPERVYGWMRSEFYVAGSMMRTM